MIIPAPTPSPCPVCRAGCGCPPTAACCGHYGCYGYGPGRNCPGVAHAQAAYEAVLAAKRATQARTLSRRARLSALYRDALIASFIAARPS